MKAKYMSKEHKKKLSEKAKERFKDPKERIRMKKLSLKAYKDPIKKENHKKGCKHNNFTKDARQKAKLSWQKKLHFPFKNTRPEQIMKKLLDDLHIKYECDYLLFHETMGYHKVDIMILDHNNKPYLALEIDGCYWHGCPRHYPNRKRKRDVLVNQGIQGLGIKLYRIWECQIDEKRRNKEEKRLQKIEWQLSM